MSLYLVFSTAYPFIRGFIWVLGPLPSHPLPTVVFSFGRVQGRGTPDLRLGDRELEKEGNYCNWNESDARQEQAGEGGSGA